MATFISSEEHIKYHDGAFRYNVTIKEIKKAVMKEVPLPPNAYERIGGKYAEVDVVKEDEKVKSYT